MPVSVVNKSTLTWDSEDKEIPVFISYHLLDAKGDTLSWNNILTPFNKPIEPGESVTVNLIVNAPADAGDYYAEVDMVRQEHAGPEKGKKIWFKNRGSKTALIPLSTR